MLPVWIKNILFGKGKRLRRIVAGPGRGITLLADPASDSQRLLGLGEAELYRYFQPLAKASNTFVDVGASNGWYCILAKKLKPSLELIACEPIESLGQDFLTNVEANGWTMEGITLIPYCVGVRDYPLDSLLLGKREPILIKIDVEGAEADVLMSGQKTLSLDKCALILETHSRQAENECLGILKGFGYAVSIVNPAWYRFLVPEHRPLPHNRWLVAQRSGY